MIVQLSSAQLRRGVEIPSPGQICSKQIYWRKAASFPSALRRAPAKEPSTLQPALRREVCGPASHSQLPQSLRSFRFGRGGAFGAGVGIGVAGASLSALRDNRAPLLSLPRQPDPDLLPPFFDVVSTVCLLFAVCQYGKYLDSIPCATFAFCVQVSGYRLLWCVAMGWHWVIVQYQYL